MGMYLLMLLNLQTIRGGLPILVGSLRRRRGLVALPHRLSPPACSCRRLAYHSLLLSVWIFFPRVAHHCLWIAAWILSRRLARHCLQPAAKQPPARRNLLRCQGVNVAMLGFLDILL
ncbi:hypothetical protein D1007_02742 [Hordeum vulgare]|nr:hypothetical protein D1007_02742 [Hordeum vulgare]